MPSWLELNSALAREELSTISRWTWPTPALAQEAGITETLAHDRASRVSAIRYDLAFALPRDKASPVTAREVVSFTLGDTAPLALDFEPGSSGRVRSVQVEGRRVSDLP